MQDWATVKTKNGDVDFTVYSDRVVMEAWNNGVPKRKTYSGRWSMDEIELLAEAFAEYVAEGSR